METTIAQLKSVNSHRKQLKKELNDLAPAVFILKDEISAAKYDKLYDEHKATKRQLYSLLEQL